jgi:hypothetical protein
MIITFAILKSSFGLKVRVTAMNRARRSMQTFTHCHALYETEAEKANERSNDLGVKI